MFVDIAEMKKYVDESGIKQKTIADKSGLSEASFCMVLQGKRKLEAGEYATICNVINVPLTRFVSPRKQDKEVK